MTFTRVSVLAAFALSAVAEKSQLLEIGHVVSQEVRQITEGSYTRPLGNGTVSQPIWRPSNVIVIDVGATRYTLSEYGIHPIKVSADGTLPFYRDKTVFVVTEGKKKYRFTVIEVEQLR